MSQLDTRFLAELSARGVMSEDVPTGGRASAEMFRRETPVPQRPYPGQAELLQDEAKQLAGGSKRMVRRMTEALKGIIEGNPYTETFGVTRAPIGNFVDPFFRVDVQPDMPFEFSSISPAFDDPKLTAQFYEHTKKLLASKKYSATAPEIKQAVELLNSFGEPYHIVLQAGFAAGPKIHASNVRQAIILPLLLEGMATAPDTAEMSVRGNERWKKRSGVLARSNYIESLHGELAVMKAKGSKASGPLLADAINMFLSRLGPSIGLRKGRGPNDIPLTPKLDANNPLIQQALRAARKDIGAREAAKFRQMTTQEFRALDAEGRYKAIADNIEKFLSVDEEVALVRNAGGNLQELPADKRLVRVMRSLEELYGTEARDRIVQMTAGRTGPTIRPGVQRRGPEAGIPSETRLTKKVVKEKILKPAEAEKIMKQTAKRLGVTPKNPVAVLAIAALLSAAMYAGMGEREAA
jgi:hypothetical protein